MREKRLRRTVLKSLGGIGATAVIGSQASQAQPVEKDRPRTYSKHGTQGSSFEKPAYFRHIADLSTGQKRVRQYERTGDAEYLLTEHLKRKIKQQETVDIQVQTTGRRSQIRSKGNYNRQLNGWQPTPAEITRLSDFGTVSGTPDVASTNVGVFDVLVDDLGEIADLPFVWEIGLNPAIEDQNEPKRQITDRSDTRRRDALSASTSTPTVSDIKSSSHSYFDSVSHTLDSGMRVGLFIAGYDTSGTETNYDTPWASDIGIDESLAKDFTGSGGWKGSSGHASDVADTNAVMLSEFSSGNHFVPLRTYNESAGEVYASDFSNAIDYALKYDIPVSVTALVVISNVSYCPSSVCAELDSYTSAGYAMTVASGTDDISGKVDDPAGSYHTIGVGSYIGSTCSGGYEYRDYTQYGYIDYYDNLTYCSWCKEDSPVYSKFCPDLHACGEFTPDNNSNTLIGTSMASPIVGAGTALHASVNGPTEYDTHLDKYQAMSNYEVCPDETSKLGEVIHIPDLV